MPDTTHPDIDSPLNPGQKLMFGIELLFECPDMPLLYRIDPELGFVITGRWHERLPDSWNMTPNDVDTGLFLMNEVERWATMLRPAQRSLLQQNASRGTTTDIVNGLRLISDELASLPILRLIPA